MWSSWQEFWAMNGHGPYIWASYGVFFAVIVVECWRLRARRRAALVAARRVAAREAAGAAGRKIGSPAA